MGKKKDFAWRYQPPINSDKAKMLSFIQNQRLHPFQDKTMMIMTALNAYYMPLALHNEGSCSREDLELIFLDGVNAIANHLRYVCIAIKIDSTAVSQILCSTFGLSEIIHPQPEKQLITEIQLPVSNIYEESDNFDPQMWNLAGITTDSESFD
jgi:hypothetical protein